MPKPFSALLLDVGGTLWPDTWMVRQDGLQLRAERMHRSLPQLPLEECLHIDTELQSRSRAWETALTQSTIKLIEKSLGALNIEADEDTLHKIREAMCLPAKGQTALFSGAKELLETCRGLELKTIVISNAGFRTAADYRQDFEAFGVAHLIDGFVSSVDEGFRKPHPAIFGTALKLAACQPKDAIMFGNSERNDITPAVALGLRTVLACIESPPPLASCAQAVVTSLTEAQRIIRDWIAG